MTHPNSWRRALVIVALAYVSAAVTARVPQDGQAPGAGTPCAQLASLVLPNLTIVSADDVAAGAFSLAGATRPLTTPAFCRVVAVATPTSDSEINLEVWIPPAPAWNGKLLGTGNGGFGGAIGYPAMAHALSLGYATVGTDAGHTGDQMEFGRGHREKIVDWAYRSVHVMTEVAKLVIRDHTGTLPTWSYFDGCSTGGQQALSEAQRYPDDYDGIVAGDPGNNRLNLIYGFLWSWMATHAKDGQPILTPASLSLLATGSIAACDATDGVTDGIIGDPLHCHFDPGTLLCSGQADDACLTPAQVAAAKKVYAGAHNPRTGDPIYPGWVPGSELGWGTYITRPREPVRIGLFRDFIFGDQNWDWRTFDWDRDVRYVDRALPYLSAMSTDLSGFKSAGGKLVMYTGLADPVVPPGDPTTYYDRVVQAMGGLAATQAFFRFFPVPGMGHCGGGVGPSTFDALGALEAWVEHGAPPSTIPASRRSGGAVTLTRPLCPYPAVARYTGRGSTNDAENFACVARTTSTR